MNFNTPGMGTYGALWEAHGYSGNGNVTELINSAVNRPAIVVGSSFQVFSDLTNALSRLDDPLIFAVNDIGMFLPKVDHWVSLHAGNMKAWKAVRWQYGRDVGAFHTYEREETGQPWYDWTGLNPLFALSGYFAMQIAYIMGCNPIILCGCPGSPARRFFESDTQQGHIYVNGGGIQQQVISEMVRLPDFKKSVRSMSGWTREYFGGVSHSWGRRGPYRRIENGSIR